MNGIVQRGSFGMDEAYYRQQKDTGTQFDPGAQAQYLRYRYAIFSSAQASKYSGSLDGFRVYQLQLRAMQVVRHPLLMPFLKRGLFLCPVISNFPVFGNNLFINHTWKDPFNNRDLLIRKDMSICRFIYSFVE